MNDQPSARIGQEVRLPGAPPIVGTVLGIKTVDGQVLYEVFITRDDRRFVPARSAIPIPDERDVRVIDRDEFLRRVLLFKLSTPLSDVLYTYGGSRTRFEVYQFKPVFKFLASDRRSLLIADEVGLGKTIEACLIYLELKARSDLPRVLVLCPAALKEKWRSELKLRFDEEFSVLDSKGVTQFLKDYEGTDGLQRLRAIVGLETIRKTEFQERMIDIGLELDLLVIDEAHHVRNDATETHKAARLLADRAENVLLLTATPLQTSTEDLFNVLQLIDPGTFTDFYSFAEQLKPNAFVNEAIGALSKSVPDVARAIEALDILGSFPEYRKHPVLRQTRAALATPAPMTPDRMVVLRRDLLELNSLAFVFNRTRKKDVADTAVRSSNTVRVRLSPVERTFYDAMIRYARREVESRGGIFAAFAMVTRERQAASCLVATRKYLEETLRTRQSQIHVEDVTSDIDADPDGSVQQSDVLSLEQLVEISRELGEADSKFAQLGMIVNALAPDAADNKVLIFSFFRRTIEYLRERLVRDGFNVYTIHGGVPVDERQHRLAAFEDDPKPAILLSTEVGAEGLDLQFCDTLVNYDLPWNPMKVEQRIGRIDRYGQKRQKIRIVNLVLDETIETRILERLYDRIEIFSHSIGDLEPILGPEIQHLTQEVLARDLTPEEEQRLVDLSTNRLAQLRMEQDAFDRQRADLMAQDALFLSEVETAVDSGRVVSPAELQAILRGWLAAEFPASSLEPVDDDGSWHLRAEARLMMAYQGYLAGSRERPERAVALIKLMGSRLGVPCTFDSQLARKRPALEFFHARHPFVRQAIEYFQKRFSDGSDVGEIRIARLVAEAPAPELVGEYTFFLNAVRAEAINSQITVVPIAFDKLGEPRPDVAAALLATVQRASRPSGIVPDIPGFLLMRDLQHGTMARERDRIETLTLDRNEALVESRLINTERTFRMKIRKREQWKDEAINERIIRMKDGEIANLRRQLDEKIADIERRRQVRVTYELVEGGILELVPSARIDSVAPSLPEVATETPVTEPVFVAETPAPYGEIPDEGLLPVAQASQVGAVTTDVPDVAAVDDAPPSRGTAEVGSLPGQVEPPPGVLARFGKWLRRP
jgi:ATP-dependent helicase HepA